MQPTTPMAQTAIKTDPATTVTTQALAEIRAFSGQMQEMTELICRMQAELGDKLAKAERRMESAGQALAAGEARIAERIAAFERQASEVMTSVRSGADAAKAAAENAASRSGALARDALTPLLDEISSARSAIAAGVLDIQTEAATATASLKDASRSFGAQAETTIRLQTDRFAEMIGNAFLAGQAKLAQTTDALNGAAGSLADAMLEQVAQQAARAAEQAEVAAGIEALRRTIPSQAEIERREAAAAATAARVEKAGAIAETVIAALAQTASEVQSAAMSAAQRDTAKLDEIALRQHASSAALTELAECISGLAGKIGDGGAAIIPSIEAAIRKAMATQREAEAEILCRIDALAERVDGGKRQEAARVVSADQDMIARMTAALRLVMREFGQENGRLGEHVQALSEALDLLRERIEAMSSVPTPQPAPALEVVAQPMPDATSLPDIKHETQSLQRLLVGFRLLLNSIGADAARFSGIVRGAGAMSLQRSQSAEVAQALEPKIAGLAENIAGFGARLDDIGADIRTLALKVAVDQPPEAVHAAERDSLQRILAGFRLMLRDFGQELETLRAKVSAVETPTVEVSLAPLTEAAREISTGVAESLAAIETRLDAPLGQLLEAAAEGATLLSAAREAMARPALAIAQVEPAAAAPAADLIADALARIERAAEIVDGRTIAVERLAQQVNRKAATAGPELQQLAGDLGEAAAALRSEAGGFLAVGAALSRDLERSAGAEAVKAAPAQKSSRPIRKMRVA